MKRPRPAKALSTTKKSQRISVEPLLPVPIPHTSAKLARGIRAGRWVFATGQCGTDYVNGIAPDVLRADHPLNGESQYKRESRRLYRNVAEVLGEVGASFPDVVRPVIDYERFPTIDSGQPPSEAAPTDTFQVAAHAKNKADARRFLKFASSSAANAKLAKSLGSFPTNKFAPVAGTVLDLSSYKVLTDAKNNLVQGYDRDVPADMASPASRPPRRRPCRAPRRAGSSPCTCRRAWRRTPGSP